MNSKTNYLLKNVGILTISNFASKILVFLLVPLYTSVLSTEEYGLYDLSVSTVTLLYPLLTLNIVDAVMRFSMDKNYSKKSIITNGVKYIGVSCIIFGIGIFGIKYFNFFPQLKGLELLIFLYYISYTYNQFIIQLAKGLELVKDMGIAGVISTIITLGANIVFLLMLKWNLSGFFMASILAQTSSSIYLTIKTELWKYTKITFLDRSINKEMLAYSVPLIATALGWWINSTSDRYVVTFLCGITANGLLSVSYKIPQIINTLQGIFVQAWQISAIKEYGKKEMDKFYGYTFSIMNFLMSLACSCLILLTRPIATILYANDFYQAWEYVPFLLIASVFNSASGMLGPILAAKKDSKAMMWSAIIGAFSNIIMNVVLVYWLGIQGATIATAVCSWIIYIIRKKAVGNDIKIKNDKIIISTWILISIQALVEIYFRFYWLESLLVFSLFMLNFRLIKELIFILKRTVFQILNKKEKTIL